MARTLLFYHPDCTRHDAGQGHPERPQRLHAIMEHLENRDLLDQVPVSFPEEAGISSLELVHTSAHIENVSRLGALGRPVAVTRIRWSAPQPTGLPFWPPERCRGPSTPSLRTAPTIASASSVRPDITPNARR